MKKRVNNAQKIRKHPLPALFMPLGIYQNINIETDSADICEFCSVCNAHVDILCFSAQKQVYRRFRFARKIHHSGKIVSCSERKDPEFNIRVLTYDGGNFVHCSVAACRNNELFSVFYRFLCNFDRMSLVLRFFNDVFNAAFAKYGFTFRKQSIAFTASGHRVNDKKHSIHYISSEITQKTLQ